MMTGNLTPANSTAGNLTGENCRIVVNSIGDAGANMVGVLKQVLPLSEARLAALLYQAPAELIGGLTETQAVQINGLLRSTGLDCAVLRGDEPYIAGDGAYEVALAVKPGADMAAIAQEIVALLGVRIGRARAILCASPTVLMGSVSANTVVAVRRRFARLGAELDVSQPTRAVYDLFLGACTAHEQARVRQILRELKQPLLDEHAGDAQPLLAVGLSKSEADRLWEQLRRTSLPVRLVNRDFERFDLRLDAVPRGSHAADAARRQALCDYLAATTGMPPQLAPKVLARAPVVIQQNIPFGTMAAQLEAIMGLGGQASGHLLAFQVFGIVLDKVGEVPATVQLLQVLGGVQEVEALAAVGPQRTQVGTMTSPQARWLQQELKRVRSESRVILL